MAQSNYQEPIEQKDLDLGKKIHEESAGKSADASMESSLESSKEENEIVPETGKEADAEKVEEKVSEKIEETRKAISTQQTSPAANVSSDAQSVADIQEFEKKVEKLVEIAVQKGPEHAIQVARHMDKGKDPATADNYTLDEIHDRLMEDELRSQLMQKGLLKEL